MRVPEFLLRLGYTQKDAAQVGIRQFQGRVQVQQNAIIVAPSLDLSFPPGNVLILVNVAAQLTSAAQYPRGVAWTITSPGGAVETVVLDGREFTNTSLNVQVAAGWQGELVLPFRAQPGWQLQTQAYFGAAAATNAVEASAEGWVVPAPTWLSAI